ncbi:hypothetical protein ACQEVY_23440 [Streptomyces sp. CA-288835]|uniref:hypothetical protein n=1 Tax=Streptomyces sp. CA-288835 TaxID=3240069 RepID=UPI003D8A965F
MPIQNRPVTEEDYQRVAELHARGMGRNAIAREVGRVQRTVRVIAHELGLTFDVRRDVISFEWISRRLSVPFLQTLTPPQCP